MHCALRHLITLRSCALGTQQNSPPHDPRVPHVYRNSTVICVTSPTSAAALHTHYCLIFPLLFRSYSRSPFLLFSLFPNTATLCCPFPLITHNSHKHTQPPNQFLLTSQQVSVLPSDTPLKAFSSKANSPDDSAHNTEGTTDMQTVLGALQELLVSELCNTVLLLALGAAKGTHGARNSESITLFPKQPFGLFVQRAVKGDHRSVALAATLCCSHLTPDTLRSADGIQCHMKMSKRTAHYVTSDKLHDCWLS